jgi:hypothetical protein
LVYTHSRHWHNAFPLTYSVGRHPVLRESHTRRPNHTMQPTAGRRTALLFMTKTRSFQMSLALASGG